MQSIIHNSPVESSAFRVAFSTSFEENIVQNEVNYFDWTHCTSTDQQTQVTADSTWKSTALNKVSDNKHHMLNETKTVFGLIAIYRRQKQSLISVSAPAFSNVIINQLCWRRNSTRLASGRFSEPLFVADGWSTAVCMAALNVMSRCHHQLIGCRWLAAFIYVFIQLFGIRLHALVSGVTSSSADPAMRRVRSGGPLGADQCWINTEVT